MCHFVKFSRGKKYVLSSNKNTYSIKKYIHPTIIYYCMFGIYVVLRSHEEVGHVKRYALKPIERAVDSVYNLLC